jgi:hypothetical protein
MGMAGGEAHRQTRPLSPLFVNGGYPPSNGPATSINSDNGNLNFDRRDLPMSSVA